MVEVLVSGLRGLEGRGTGHARSAVGFENSSCGFCQGHGISSVISSRAEDT